ncbi:MAG: hypothetical protein M1836_007002 [Candelina mexicana]|nr:MAG: hypothetical protein M1836_007002 [Candelina mexicana]
MASGSEGTQTAAIHGVCIAFAIVSGLAICLRLYGRIFVARAIGSDDAEHYGMGHHIETVPQANFPTYLKVVWLGSLFYNACLGCIKASVLALYARLGDPALRRLSLFMIGVIAAQALSSVLTCIFQCKPVNGVWDPTVTHMKCVNISAFYLANAALNILTDFLTYTLPLRLVWQLQMPRRQKTGVALMLCLGLFACISSIIRITFVPRLLSSHDGTYAIAPAQYWSVIETNIGILAASIPSFKAVANRWLPRLLNTGSYNEAPGGSSNLGSGPWGRHVYGKGSKGEGSGSKDSDGLEDGLWGNNGFGKLEGKTVADAEVLGLPIQGPRGGTFLPLVRNGTAKTRGQAAPLGDEEYVPKPLRPRIGTVIESRYPCTGAGAGGGGANNDGGGVGEGRGSAETASEELMVVPEGEIVKQTQIMRHVSGESYRDGSLF